MVTQPFAWTVTAARVDSAWEQKKLEARKTPANAAESPAPSVRFVRRYERKVYILTIDLANSSELLYILSPFTRTKI